MKLLVVLLVVLFGVWLWRQGRLADKQARPPPRGKTPPALPNPMVQCAICGLHLPEAEAVTGGRRTFCSIEHQRQAER